MNNVSQRILIIALVNASGVERPRIVKCSHRHCAFCLPFLPGVFSFFTSPQVHPLQSLGFSELFRLLEVFLLSCPLIKLSIVELTQRQTSDILPSAILLHKSTESESHSSAKTPLCDWLIRFFPRIYWPCFPHARS